MTLPYFNYTMNVRAYHHIPESRGISVTGPLTEDFVLEHDAREHPRHRRHGRRARRPTRSTRPAPFSTSLRRRRKDEVAPLQISADLVDLGYDVTEETSADDRPG